MKKRSGFTVMARLIGLVKPLTGYMILAIIMGLIGHLCAAFITIFGGYAVLEVLDFDTRFCSYSRSLKICRAVLQSLYRI